MKRIVVGLFMLAFVLVPTPAQATVLTMHCSFSHHKQVDPILAYGLFPSAHDHAFFGNRSTDENSTPDTLFANPQSTCATAGDFAAYWTPVAYVNGIAVLAKAHVGEYWLNNGRKQVEAPPFGAEMVAGFVQGATIGRVEWHCTNGGHALSPVGMQCTGTQRLKYEVFFPTCWNGLNPGDRTNFSYDLTASCLHPIAQLGLQVDLPVQNISGVTLASGDWSTAHADFMNAWDPEAFAALVDGCLNGIGACPPHA